MNRDEQIFDLRPDLLNISRSHDTLEAEQFQNEILRPILKLQNDVLVVIIDAYLIEKKFKNDASNSSVLEKFVATALSNDLKLRNMVIGMIVGLLQTNEIHEYLKNENEYRKRIINMVGQRYMSNKI